MSKAIILPINILVIVAVATVAMLGLVGVYGVGYNPFSSAMSAESAKNTACRQLVFGGCKANTSDIKVNYSSATNLFDLCKNVFGRTDEKSCKQLCGCVGATTTTGGPTGGGISLNPSSGTTSPGGTLTSTVTVTRFNSTVSEVVSLTLSGCPAGSTCTLSAPSCNANPTCSVTLSITAGPNPGGPYSITITGIGSVTGIIKTATYKLTISSVSCTCLDGTICNSCSSNKPKFCTVLKQLIDYCSYCGCPPATPQCNADGSCSAGGVCNCNWNDNFACGGALDCNFFGLKLWESKCVCSIPNCGLCPPPDLVNPPQLDGTLWCRSLIAFC